MLKRLTFLLLLCFTSARADQPNFFESAIKNFLEKFLDDEGQESFNQTSHLIDIPSGRIQYTAITGTLPQYTDTGEVAGNIFFTAYLKDEAKEDRPLTFIFNGGPGGSSMSMHIAGFGPRRILFPEEGQTDSPPHKLIDNPETILDLSDIVMIDPIDTGYSRIEDETYSRFFYSVEGDLVSFGEFIRLFCIHFNRWNSPKYLAGASYGTLRAAGLSEYLPGYLGIYLKGIVLMSCALDYNLLIQQRDLPLSDCFSIPTYAATAWYHGRTMQDKPVEEVVEHARRFTNDHYIPVMLQPSRLSPLQQTAFYKELAELIGLPVETIQQFEGRLSEESFIREFFAAERKQIGGIDSRYVGDVSSIGGEWYEDPSYRDRRQAFSASFFHYMQNELETTTPFPHYNLFSRESSCRWNYSTYDNPSGLPSFMQRLRRALIINPNMKVFVGSGYYDIRTPFAATEYSLEHLELPDSYRKNFQVEYYKAGHAYIFDLASLQKFKKDLVKFYGK
jgi:carboxypeptidase C (cathepsin A)